MSSTFGGVSAAQPVWAQNLQSTQPNPQQVLQPAAQLLGTTAQNLISQMQSGTTLSDLASQQGVSQSDLIGAIEQGLQAANPSAAQTGSQANQATLATNIANGTAKIGHHHHHHHSSASTSASSSASASALGLDDSSDGDGDTDSSTSTSSSTSTVNSLAAILGLDPATVQQLLNSGSTVSSLANGSGLPASDLQSLFSTGLQVDTTA